MAVACLFTQNYENFDFFHGSDGMKMQALRPSRKRRQTYFRYVCEIRSSRLGLLIVEIEREKKTTIVDAYFMSVLPKSSEFRWTWSGQALTHISIKSGWWDCRKRYNICQISTCFNFDFKRAWIFARVTGTEYLFYLIVKNRVASGPVQNAHGTLRAHWTNPCLNKSNDCILIIGKQCVVTTL